MNYVFDKKEIKIINELLVNYQVRLKCIDLNKKGEKELELIKNIFMKLI